MIIKSENITAIVSQEWYEDYVEAIRNYKPEKRMENEIVSGDFKFTNEGCVWYDDPDGSFNKVKMEDRMIYMKKITAFDEAKKIEPDLDEK